MLNFKESTVAGYVVREIKVCRFIFLKIQIIVVYTASSASFLQQPQKSASSMSMGYEQHHSTSSSVNELAGMSSVARDRDKTHNPLEGGIDSQRESLEPMQHSNGRELGI